MFRQNPVLARLHNQRFVQPFLLNSVPKAGTNLLSKAIGLFPGVRQQHVSFLPHDVWSGPVETAGSPLIAVGVGGDRMVPRQAVAAFLQKVARGAYLRGHIPHSADMVELLGARQMKSVLILRDPRDVVISHVNYVVSNPRHRLRDKYLALNEAERIMTTIHGFAQEQPAGPMLLNIGARFELFTGWLAESTSHTVYFEKLVGPRGGGSAQEQRQTLAAIGRQLDLWHRPEHLEQIADRLFGGTNTFRKGTVGSWREKFSPAHKAAFKEVTGRLLIELGYERDNNW